MLQIFLFVKKVIFETRWAKCRGQHEPAMSAANNLIVRGKNKGQKAPIGAQDGQWHIVPAGSGLDSSDAAQNSTKFGEGSRRRVYLKRSSLPQIAIKNKENESPSCAKNEV